MVAGESLAQAPHGAAGRRESRQRLWLVAEGFPEPTPHWRIVLPDGKWMAPDLVWEDARVCPEYERDRHRADPDQFREDIRRVRALEACGWRCLRVSADVWTERGWRALSADLDRALTWGSRAQLSSLQSPSGDTNCTLVVGALYDRRHDPA